MDHNIYIFSWLFSVGHVNTFMMCQRKCNAGTCSQIEENSERKKRKNHISHDSWQLWWWCQNVIFILEGIVEDKRKGGEKENSLLCWLCALVHQRLQWECNHPKSSFPLFAILTLLDSGGLGCDGTITLFPITFSHQNQGHLLKSSSKVLINNNKEMLLTCQALKRERKHFPKIISFCKPALWILLNSPLNISTGNEIQMDCLSISSCPTYISCVWSRSCQWVPYTSREIHLNRRAWSLVNLYPEKKRYPGWLLSISI